MNSGRARRVWHIFEGTALILVALVGLYVAAYFVLVEQTTISLYFSKDMRADLIRIPEYKLLPETFFRPIHHIDRTYIRRKWWATVHHT
jgi:hypothetical protein